MSETPQISDDEIEKLVAEAQKSAIRQRVEQKAGDLQSQHGTTNDIAVASLHLLAMQILAIAQAETIEEYFEHMKASMEEYAGLAGQYLAAVEGGIIRPPVLEKGLEQVFAEMGPRLTAITEGLEEGGALKPKL